VMTVMPGQGPCLMCLYEGREYAGGVIPVLGTMPGITGCIQATEVIKIVTGLGAPLSGRLLLFDGRGMHFSELAPGRNPRCPHCGEPPNGEPPNGEPPNGEPPSGGLFSEPRGQPRGA
jgi:adenylyltransferase/sulfurtransferase